MNNIKSCNIFVYIHNKWHRARPCIDSILMHTKYKNNSVFFIDDASNTYVSNQLLNYLSRHKDKISIIRNDKFLGYVKSVNKALKQSNADYITVVNSDVVVTPSWVSKMIACFEREKNIGLVSPLANSGNNNEIPMIPGTDVLQMNRIVEKYSSKNFCDIEVAENFCFMVSRACLEKMGYLDEIFSDPNAAINDLCNRAKYYGFRTVCSNNVYIYHKKENMKNCSIYRESKIDNEILYRRWRHLLNTNKKIEAPSTLKKFRSQLENLQLRDILPKKELTRDKNNTNKLLNILCILPTLNPYGGVISVVNLMNHLIEMGHNCTIISLSRCDTHPHVFYAEPIYIQNWDEIPDKFAFDFDVFLATSWETVDLIVRLKQNTNYGNAYYFVQDLEEKFYDNNNVEKRKRARETYNKIKYKIVKTNYLYKALQSSIGKVFKVRPGMNLDLFYPRPVVRSNKTTILGMVRLGHYHRGYDLIIKTFEKVAKLRPNTDFILFGSNNLDQLKLNFEYTNMGRVKPEDLPELYSRADIFVEMSRHHGFGRTGVEAMACGTACVLSDSGGISEYAKHGENSLIVPVEDVEAAVKQICFLIDNPSYREKLVEKGKMTVSLMSDRKAAEEFLNVIYATANY